jgi:hypothetical protein
MTALGSYFSCVTDLFLILEDATRFKHLRKYMYNYEAESSSGVPGTADSRSATKINCKVGKMGLEEPETQGLTQPCSTRCPALDLLRVSRTF